MKWQHLATSKGPWARYAIICAALLWLSLLALLLLQQDISCPAQFPASQQHRPHPHFGPVTGGCQQLRYDLEELRTEVQKLHDENQQLRKLADMRPVEAGKKVEDGSKIVHSEERSELRRIKPTTVAGERSSAVQLYSKDHELARRTLANSIWELFLRFNGPEMRKILGEKEHESWGRQLEHLVVQTRTFAAVDGADDWHKRELRDLGQMIGHKLEALQNPSEDCANARIMLCELNKGCGFGCQLHHLTYCLIMSAAANRTLLLERDGQEWRYSEKGWTAAFQPVSKCSWAKHVSPFHNLIEPFMDLAQSARIIRLPIVDGLAARPPHLPLSIPSQFANHLLIHHSNPPAFFIGQILSFLMRLNENAKEFVHQAEKKIPFELGPVVGLQIRRTDKVGTEAAFHAVEEYMEWAELWFRIEQARLGVPLAKRAFIATDERAVIGEAREKYGPKGWTIYGNDETAEAAQPGNRYSDRSLLGVITDVQLLAKCSYIVCTFSSQVCRMGYELMQTEQGDAGERAHSLDDIFYFGGQHAHEVEAVGDFKPEDVDQIDMFKGDVIGIAGNHWNGWSKGTNRRNGQHGLFPSYLVKEKWRTANFPIFGQ